MCSCTEIWKDVLGFEGIYKVSNLGRIKSLDRIDNSNHHRKERMLKQSTTILKYKVITFTKNSVKKQFKVHRIIAIAFIPNPKNKPFINHIDGITSNNELNNLEWCTPKENSIHAIKIGLYNAIGENNGRSLLTEEDVKQIRCMWKYRKELTKNCKLKITQTKISKLFGVKLNVVHAIVNYKTWKSV